MRSISRSNDRPKRSIATQIRSSHPIEFDVAVVGGGPAGTATALALRRAAGLSVALVDRGQQERWKIGETLQPGCRALLEQLGAWEKFEAAGHTPSYGTCSAWGGHELAYRDYLFQPYGTGWHLDRRRFDEHLLELVAASGVVVLRPATVTMETRYRAEWKLRLRRGDDGPPEIGARFVVDASGRRAAFARRQGARKVLFDHLVGTYCFFALDPERPLRHSFTFVEAAEEGWWYSAVLPEKRLVAVYMTDADRVRALRLRDERRWLSRAHASDHTCRRLEGARLLTDPAVAPASSHLLAPIAGPGWLAAGDAASSFDPLSAHGIANALRGGLRAADAVRDCLAGGKDGGEAYQGQVVAEFERYLDMRQTYYRMETRWPNSSFWSRRQGIITLHPSRRLRCVDADRADGLKMHMRPDHLRELAGLCRPSQPAHELVSTFRRRHADAYTDGRVILALQYLVEAGVLTAG